MPLIQSAQMEQKENFQKTDDISDENGIIESDIW